MGNRFLLNGLKSFYRSADQANFDFHLKDGSPCTGSGANSIEVSGTGYNSSNIDLAQEGALNNCPEVVKKAVHIAADIILEKV